MSDRPRPEEHADVGDRIRELTAGIEAPPALRERLAETPDARTRSRTRRRWLAIPAGGAIAAAAVVLALVLGGGAAGPTVDDAAAVALQRPNLPAPKVDPSDVHLVEVKVDGLPFPNYAYEWRRWTAVGHRVSTIDGRAAKTVTYRGPLGDVGYTIVSGAPLGAPDGARRRTVRGVDLAITRHGDAVVVTWERQGHTCVLAGRGAGIEERLVSFATWA